MKKIELRSLVLMALIFIYLGSPVFGAVTPGEVIKSNNCEKIEGMVPARILDLVKNGKLEMKIGELNYEPADYFPDEQLKAKNEGINKGLYGIDEEENCIYNTKTNVKYPKDVMGLPFPDIDEKDPKAGMKVAYNLVAQIQQRYARGNFYAAYPTTVTNPEGIERQQVIGNKAYWEPPDEKYDFYYISWMIAPYDLAGYGTLRWIMLDPKKKTQRWTTIPPMRKTRRLRGLGNDSQTSYKLKTAQDDVWALGSFAHVNRTKYILAEKKIGLLPYWKADPLYFNEDTSTGYKINCPEDAPLAQFGAITKDWKGAPWAILDIIWVEQPAYVLKFKVDTEGYIYGDTESWVHAEAFTSGYKIVDDRKGAPMKEFMYVSQAVKTKDDSFRYLVAPSMLMATGPDEWGQIRFDLGFDGSKIEYRKNNYAIEEFTPGGILRYLK